MAEISKGYEPQAVEAKWYSFWLEKRLFVAKADSTKPAWSMVIPPPNVTGVLTLGHVLNNTIQDILARKARMDGNEVLWLPGTDHAGIATQTVVERALKKQGAIKHRDDLGRDGFLEKAWEWKEKHGGIIIEQLKRLGASCDWSRERFTMDPDYSRCVQRIFVELYRKGLIYRGRRMVNWCPATLTALSDEEVIMKEQTGFLYYFKVEVAEEPGTFLTIATTRPETIPGDTAVAVHPRDPRYARFIGKHVVRPLPAALPLGGKLIPIIGDEHVDFEFGTGVLKVTPAHDKADFEIGQRHHLPIIEALNPDGTMSEAAGMELRGLDRFQARRVAVEQLRNLGLLEKEAPYTNHIGFSERADVPVEPRLSEQWFLKYPRVTESRAVVAGGGIRFYPDRWAGVYEHWMNDIQDWCVSRQLWWGHRIPVWHKKHATVADAELGLAGLRQTPLFHPVLRGETLEVATEDPALQKELEALGFHQDPDVLDTWFSAWLWPFATMGWPRETATLKKFYPTTDLVTGPDIIFFWVARMIMAAFEFTGEPPFRNVYFTGIIRDKQGRKMSKSLGNSPDPLDLIDKYGADGLRFGVMRGAPLGQDILFDEQNVELGRNFCNKLWNACRFRQMQGGEVQGEIDPGRLSGDDKWILLKLNTAILELTGALGKYNFSEATQTIHRFFWNEFCDWHLEASKAVFQGTDEAGKANALAVLDFVLSHTLRLLHPFLPFITEELWHGMGYQLEMPADQGGESIMFAPWPKAFAGEFRSFYGLEDRYVESTDAKHDLVSRSRNLRREANIPSHKRIRFVLKPAREIPSAEAAVLKILLNADPLEISPDYSPKKGTPGVHSELGSLYLPLEGVIDETAEKARLTRELEKIQAEIVKVKQKLANPAFTQKVPAEVLREHERRKVDWEAKQHQVEAALSALES